MKTPIVFPPCDQGSGSNQEPTEVDLSVLKSGAYHDVATGKQATDNQIVMGNDPRLDDARKAADVPVWAKQKEKPKYTPKEVGAAEADHGHELATEKKAGFMSPADKKAIANIPNALTEAEIVKLIDTRTKSFVRTSDSRLSDARPSSDVKAWAKGDRKPTYTADEIGAAKKDHTHKLATLSAAGFMSPADRGRMDGLKVEIASLRPIIPTANPHTVAVSDMGGSIDTNQNVVLPALLDRDTPVGITFTITNTGKTEIKITPSNGVHLRIGGEGASGEQLLLGFGVATLRKINETTWTISGPNVVPGDSRVDQMPNLDGSGVTYYATPTSPRDQFYTFASMSFYVAENKKVLRELLEFWDMADAPEIQVFRGREIKANNIITTFVEDMEGLLQDMRYFNQDISAWDVTSVHTMRAMFRRAVRFNKPLSGWNTSGVLNMDFMFTDAAAFRSNISNWCVLQIDTPAKDFAEGALFYEETLRQPMWGLCPPQNDERIHTAREMLDTHLLFLKNNTGVTHDARKEHYVFNDDGVLANNRHFISFSQMVYQPNGDATSEGQVLQIIGHMYAYMANKDPEQLRMAIWCFDAYVKYFYDGDPIPHKPERWIANWIINGKEPVLSNWPLNTENRPTHGGFRGVPFDFVNGQVKIPHGEPHWGEYLDKSNKAYTGVPAWGSMDATIMFQNEDGTTDWDRYGDEYPVAWIINWEGDKVDWDGNILSSNHLMSEYGTIQLKDTSLNGSYKLNYANRQPLEFGGTLIERNEVQHNRPLHVPLRGSRELRGNAADAEQWFVDACYLLYLATGEERYKRALEACLYTTMEYVWIDRRDKFFRRSLAANTPFTDGVAYDFTYPSGVFIDYTRDERGYIVAKTETEADIFLEQQTVWFRVNQESRVRTTYGGVGNDGSPIFGSVRVQIADTRDPDPAEAPRFYVCDLPASTSSKVNTTDVALNNFMEEIRPDGVGYLVASTKAMSVADGIDFELVYDTDVYDGRAVNVVRTTFNDNGHHIIGRWLTGLDSEPFREIIYKADVLMNYVAYDVDGWRWWWDIPATGDVWSKFELKRSEANFAYWQPKLEEDPDAVPPDLPGELISDQYNIIMDDSSNIGATFTWYAVNGMPERYMKNDGHILLYRIIANNAAENGQKLIIGDCTVVKPAEGALAYTPGIMPFSNIYVNDADTFDGWHGMPYPGYQYPLVFVFQDGTERMMKNMIDFMADAQDFYKDKIGVDGPVASAYIWNRWDNWSYGEPDTFTMNHWGDGKAWSGYQPRAFQAAARVWEELVQRGKPVPPRLIQYVERWINFLADFAEETGSMPYDYPTDGVPWDDGFTGHMIGLYLAGVAAAGVAGSLNPRLDLVANTCIDQIKANQVKVPGNIMTGGWTPALRENTGSGVESNAMFFGFWSGELLRGLGAYMLWKGKQGKIYRVPRDMKSLRIPEE